MLLFGASQLPVILRFQFAEVETPFFALSFAPLGWVAALASASVAALIWQLSPPRRTPAAVATGAAVAVAGLLFAAAIVGGRLCYRMSDELAATSALWALGIYTSHMWLSSLILAALCGVVGGRMVYGASMRVRGDEAVQEGGM